jgi:hypothetical protein
MPSKKTSAPKRIYNPVTGTYYSVRQRSTSSGNKGSIKGKWKQPKKKR